MGVAIGDPRGSCRLALRSDCLPLQQQQNSSSTTAAMRIAPTTPPTTPPTMAPVLLPPELLGVAAAGAGAAGEGEAGLGEVPCPERLTPLVPTPFEFRADCRLPLLMADWRLFSTPVGSLVLTLTGTCWFPVCSRARPWEASRPRRVLGAVAKAGGAGPLPVGAAAPTLMSLGRTPRGARIEATAFWTADEL